MAYEGLKKDQLQELCRQRKLTVSGTNDELVARLQGWDQAHELDELDLRELAQAPPDEPVEPEPVQAPVQAQQPPAAADPVPPTVPETEPKVFEQVYECPGTLPTELHEQWCNQTAQAAHEAGIRTRGSAHRTGFRYQGGMRYAVYEISRARR